MSGVTTVRRPAPPDRRLRLLTVVVLVVFAAMVGRLVEVQVLARPKEVRYGASEVVHKVSLPATRGGITDRNGQVLAMSIPTRDIIGDPLLVKDPNGEAGTLSPLINVPVPTLAADLSEKRGFVYLAKQVPDATATKVMSLNLPGITDQLDPMRVDPNGSLFNSLVGVVGTDQHGLSALEYQYDKQLSGEAGEETIEEGAEGVALPGATTVERPAVAGTGLQLTIDTNLQYKAQQELGAEMTATHAPEGMVIVLNSKTGGILAAVGMQSTNGPPQPAPSLTPITNVYEPGSVMKLPTYSFAVQDGIITPNTMINIPNQITVGGATFHDAENHPDETVTATQALDQSSNIGTIEVAQKLGNNGLYNAIRAFGFGQPTGVKFPGASPGLLTSPAHWYAPDIAATAIGQNEAVSLLQLADAYNAIANNGMFVPPQLVQATVDQNGAAHPVAPGKRHRVVTAATAHTLTGMLEGVVSPNGTAPGAAIPGYTVAGKTGTAQIPLDNGRGYQPGAYYASFAGFAPAQDPAVTIVVSLKHPNVIFGGAVAAPVFAHLMSYALNELHVVPPPGTFNQGAPASVPTGPGVANSTP